ncbi:MAG: bifunctional diaminohydroxyphosphoribosylaminopyrimidine deaminase/5-amino-6-(5-phosphoribosylamino)uracil reductase RibD [Planctomycetota bacterium]|jgi:diaminohydroxyphosphoribosylaminopyrimidine deaminase/5-amino-6-(5-phosphoribosylamino)uracil reductase|nr:bifunctional diaminohydroxyphosphoribosylaminopyrimidine deaminase/5-amino-6-(5-phosphoribosylamino)uracil reductase RibD [Planctomycetota bacterium]
MSDTFSPAETEFMRRALVLGERGEGRTAPNPPVGCVLVRDGQIVGEGWHDRYGGLHAETMALSTLPPGGAAGVTAYVTLSPCATQGRQPPCADALAAAGVREVVAAVVDPNPGNASGLARLRELGIATRQGLLATEATFLARGFFQRHRSGRPYLTLKYAMTLDGKIATSTGESRWISGPEARERVQDLRSRVDAILVGSGTAIADNPRLNLRDPVWSNRGGPERHPQPLRVVADSHARLSPAAALLTGDEPGGKVLLAVLAEDQDGRDLALAQAGAEIIRLPASKAHVDLDSLLRELGRRGVNHVLAEGGGELAAGLIEAGLVDEIMLFLAPKVVGGRTAPSPVAGTGISCLAKAAGWRLLEVERVGVDVMVLAGRHDS